MNDQRLPKKIILKSNAAFGRVFLLGQHIQFEYFTIYFVKQAELRIGFTTKRGYRNKPERNRMKRILRELWRKKYKQYTLPAHIVLVADGSILRADYKLLDNLMETAMFRLEKKLSEMSSENEK